MLPQRFPPLLMYDNKNRLSYSIVVTDFYLKVDMGDTNIIRGLSYKAEIIRGGDLGNTVIIRGHSDGY